jgi:hypothetical protein
MSFAAIWSEKKLRLIPGWTLVLMNLTFDSLQKPRLELYINNRCFSRFIGSPLMDCRARAKEGVDRLSSICVAESHQLFGNSVWLLVNFWGNRISLNDHILHSGME